MDWGIVIGGLSMALSMAAGALGIVWKMATFTQAMRSLEEKVDSLVDCGKAEHGEFRRKLEEHHTRITVLEEGRQPLKNHR